MDGKQRRDEEIADLKDEIENFKKEKERVKSIVGQIGGMPKFNTKIFNMVFMFLVFGSLLVSLVSRGTLRLAMVEVAIAAISVKLMFLIHKQSRVNHFQLWILSSVEWQLNEMMKIIRKLKAN